MTININAVAGLNNIDKENDNFKNAKKTSATSANKCENSEKVNSEPELVKYYLNNIQPTASKLVLDKLCNWQDIFAVEVIKKAIDEAIENNARNYKYIESILKNWEDRGLVTMSLLEAHLSGWKKSKSVNTPTQAKTNRFANFPQRQWDFDKIERASRNEL